MWIFIIVIIVGIIMIFLYQRQIMLDKMDSDGGILFKYNTLIQYILSMPNSEITNKGRDHINFICRGNGVSTYFTITPAFNVVIVQWELKGGPMFNFKEVWNFPEDRMTQHEMVNQIEKDINGKMEAIFPKEKPENDLRAISSIKPEPLSIVDYDQAYQKLFKQAIAPQLKALDRHDQAQVLSIFFQVEHDNPYFSKYVKSLFFLDGYPSYSEGLSYITQFLDQVGTGINSILSDLNTIEDIPELFRLVAIIESFHDRLEDKETALQMCEKVWRLDTQGTEHYIYNILKTRADLLIKQNGDTRACLILQDGYNELVLFKGLNSLKYQYAMSLLELSENVNFKLDFNMLLEQSGIYFRNILVELKNMQVER